MRRINPKISATVHDRSPYFFRCQENKGQPTTRLISSLRSLRRNYLKALWDGKRLLPSTSFVPKKARLGIMMKSRGTGRRSCVTSSRNQRGTLEIRFATGSFVASRSTKGFLPSRRQWSWVRPVMTRSHRPRSEDEAEDDDDDVDFEDAANEEVARATHATIYSTSLPRAVTTAASRTTTPTAGVTTTSTDALIQGLASVSVAAAAASSSSCYHDDVIADTQLGYDPEMTQLNSPADKFCSKVMNQHNRLDYFLALQSIAWKSLLAPGECSLKRPHSPLASLPERRINV
jgi:hypothetical protein